MPVSTQKRFHGPALERARLDVGFSRSELARRLGVAPGTVRNAETGAVDPSASFAASAAEELGIELDSLFSPHGEDGTPTTDVRGKPPGERLPATNERRPPEHEGA